MEVILVGLKTVEGDDRVALLVLYCLIRWSELEDTLAGARPNAIIVNDNTEGRRTMMARGKKSMQRASDEETHGRMNRTHDLHL